MFNIFHRKRTPNEKVLGVGSHLTWEKKPLPGAGAGQYAWETYGLPPYARDGFGNIHVENPLRATSPASFAFQTVGVVGLPPSGQLQGQFTTQPLMDPTAAEYQGIITPGANPSSMSYNNIVNGSKAVLNP